MPVKFLVLRNSHIYIISLLILSAVSMAGFGRATDTGVDTGLPVVPELSADTVVYDTIVAAAPDYVADDSLTQDTTGRE